MDGFINMFRREVSELEKEPTDRMSLKARLAEKKEQVEQSVVSKTYTAKGKENSL